MTKTCDETFEPKFDESFSFGNVSSDSPIQLVVYDADEQFHDMIDICETSPADVVRNGWNGQLHFYTFTESEGVLAIITFA